MQKNFVFGWKKWVLKRWQYFFSVMVTSSLAVRHFCRGIPNFRKICSSWRPSNCVVDERLVSKQPQMATKLQPLFEAVAIIISVCCLQELVHIPKSFICSILKEDLGMRPVCSMWVPHMPSHEQLEKHIQMWQENLLTIDKDPAY